MYLNRRIFSLAVPALAAIALLGAAHPAQAQTLVGTPIGAVPISPPANVNAGSNQNNAAVSYFFEQQNVVFTGPVDITTPGTYGPGGSSYPASTTLPSQTVDSFFFFSNPVGASKEQYQGSFTFANTILGLEITRADLHTTDTTLGLSTTTYANDASRGLEQNADTIILSADGHTVSWNVFNTSSDLDEVRVITTSAVTATPEPTAALPMGLALLSSLVLLRRRSVRFNQSA